MRHRPRPSRRPGARGPVQAWPCAAALLLACCDGTDPGTAPGDAAADGDADGDADVDADGSACTTSVCGETCCPEGAVCDAAGLCCLPSTCAELGLECGAPDDGCGRPLDCGACPGAAESCVEGRCLRPWTYVRVVAYDSYWGESAPTMDEVGSHAEELRSHADPRLHLALLGDAFSPDGSLWLHVDEDGEQSELRPEVSTGSADDLEAFFDWVVTSFPAERYALSFWGHGAGVLGVLPDEHPIDILEVPELEAALTSFRARAGRPIEVLYYCACLMGATEVAYALRDQALYSVAGETSVGCNQDVLVALAEDPARDARTVAVLTNQAQGTDLWTKDVVYAATDLTQMDALAALLDELAGLLLAFLDAEPGNRARLLELAATVENMELSPETPWVTSAFLDLGHLCEVLPELGVPQVTAAAAAALSFLDETVVADLFIQADALGWYQRSHGLSIFLPSATYPRSFPEHGALGFAAETRWGELVARLAAP